MEKIKIIIIEDNRLQAEGISEVLEKEGFEVKGIFDNSKEALIKIPLLNPDLVLLDIHLDDSELNGIEIAKELSRRVNIPFVFISAFQDRETIKQVTNAKPAAFLSKPFKFIDLITAVELALQRHEVSNTDEGSGRELGNQLFYNHDKLYIKTAKEYIVIPLNELFWLEAHKSYTEIVCQAGSFVVSLPLGLVMEHLGLSQLFRVHRSFAINLINLQSFTDSYVKINNKELPVGRAFRKSFFDFLRHPS